MGLLTALTRGARGAGKFGKALAQYLAITGGAGGALGAGIGAGVEGSYGGNPWDGARDGAIDGAMVGPLTIPGIATAAAGLIPVAGTAGMLHMLKSAEQPERRRRAREALAEADAMHRIEMEYEREQFERMMRNRFGGEGY